MELRSRVRAAVARAAAPLECGFVVRVCTWAPVCFGGRWYLPGTAGRGTIRPPVLSSELTAAACTPRVRFLYGFRSDVEFMYPTVLGKPVSGNSGSLIENSQNPRYRCGHQH